MTATSIGVRVMTIAMAPFVLFPVVFIIGVSVFGLVLGVSPQFRTWVQSSSRSQFVGECVRLHHGTPAQCIAASKCDTASDGEVEIFCQRQLGVWGQYNDELATGRRLPNHY